MVGRARVRSTGARGTRAARDTPSARTATARTVRRDGLPRNQLASFIPKGRSRPRSAVRTIAASIGGDPGNPGRAADVRPDDALLGSTPSRRIQGGRWGNAGLL